MCCSARRATPRSGKAEGGRSGTGPRRATIWAGWSSWLSGSSRDGGVPGTKRVPSWSISGRRSRGCSREPQRAWRPRTARVVPRRKAKGFPVQRLIEPNASIRFCKVASVPVQSLSGQIPHQVIFLLPGVGAQLPALHVFPSWTVPPRFMVQSSRLVATVQLCGSPPSPACESARLSECSRPPGFPPFRDGWITSFANRSHRSFRTRPLDGAQRRDFPWVRKIRRRSAGDTRVGSRFAERRTLRCGSSLVARSPSCSCS